MYKLCICNLPILISRIEISPPLLPYYLSFCVAQYIQPEIVDFPIHPWLIMHSVPKDGFTFIHQISIGLRVRKLKQTKFFRDVIDIKELAIGSIGHLIHIVALVVSKTALLRSFTLGGGSVKASAVGLALAPGYLVHGFHNLLGLVLWKSPPQSTVVQGIVSV